MLRALFEGGIRPDLIVGCSVGALNGAFIALRPEPAQVERLASIWKGLRRADVFGAPSYRTVVRIARRQDHVYEPTALRMLIARFCALDDLGDTAVPIHVVTTDLDHGVSRWWSSGPAAHILEASACLPGLFPPVVLRGQRHVDGGVLDPVPVGRALDLDARTIYVFGSGESVSPPVDRLSALEVLIRSFAIARYARLPDLAALTRPGQEVVVLPSTDTSGIDMRDFTQTDRLIADSYTRTKQYLAEAA
jgi:NTE family protein